MDLSGVLLVDKPVGFSSAKVVAIVKKKFQLKKVGHAGTLDPLATGLLVLLIGKATKLQSQFLNSDKTYTGEILLGKSTTTDDLEGEVIQENSEFLFSNEQSLEHWEESLVQDFIGVQEQMPPAFSAIKVGGIPSYKLARKGKSVELKPREIEIKELELKFKDVSHLEYRIHCTKGTYVRSFARDLGQRLRMPACVASIRRIKSGNFDLANAYSLEGLENIEEKLIPISMFVN